MSIPYLPDVSMKEIVRLANRLDLLGLYEEASCLDSYLKVAFEKPQEDEPLDNSTLHGQLKRYLEYAIKATEFDAATVKKRVKQIQDGLDSVQNPTARTKELASLMEQLKKAKPELT